jgi:ribosomal protein S18 acetylase RimI-like enzyme
MLKGQLIPRSAAVGHHARVPAGRILDVSDYNEFRRLRGESLDAHPEAFATDGDDWRHAPREKVEAMLSSDALSVLGLFAECLVAIVGLRLEERPAVRHKASLWGLYVTPAERGQGYATGLVETALACAAEMPGLEMVRLVVDADNTSAISVFERTGFERYGLEPRARQAAGTYHDQLYMCRFLHRASA